MNAVLEWSETLLALPEEVWVEYARRREPLRGKVDFAQYRPFWDQAVAEGKEQAAVLTKEHGALSARAYAEKIGIKVEEKPFPEGGSGRATYACFIEPDQIEIYRDNADLLKGLLEAAQAEDLFQRTDVMEVLLGHELYHAIQCRNPGLFTMQKHIRLWKIFGIENVSRLVSLEEVAAMSFAQALAGIDFTPYVYDVLLMLPHYPEQAKSVYRTLLEIQDQQRKERETV